MLLQRSMRMKLNYRIVIFAFAIVFGLFFSAPSLLQMQDGKKVTLGLDLQGGLHMLLGVKTEEATKSRIKSIAASIKNFSDRKDILIRKSKTSKSHLAHLNRCLPTLGSHRVKWTWMMTTDLRLARLG